MMSGANNYWEHAIRPSKTEDGILTAEEISELDLSKSSLVVLSACQTGLGDISNEGVIGLQRAFKMAGVETIVMSLWEIDDRATADFMGYFYKSLITGHDKRQAFREAQRQLKKKYDNPYYWAAFVMLD